MNFSSKKEHFRPKHNISEIYELKRIIALITPFMDPFELKLTFSTKHLVLLFIDPKCFIKPKYRVYVFDQKGVQWKRYDKTMAMSYSIDLREISSNAVKST